MPITAWTTPTAGDDAADAPLRTRFVGVLDARAKHVKEAVYDDTIHTPHADRPHDHCGKCSPRIYSTAVPNLLTRGLGVRDWTLSGACAQSTATGLSFSGASGAAGRRILAGSSSIAGDIAASRQAFGAGCPLTLALVARKVGTVTTATIVFGLADSTSHKTGTRGTIDIADLTTSFKRFYVLIPSYSASAHVTDCRVRIISGASWTGTGTIQVSLVYLRPGHGLAYWVPGCMETVHRGWAGTQGGPASLYDQSRDFVNATELVVS